MKRTASYTILCRRLTSLGTLLHGFTSRIGGVSRGSFESLNLSLKREQEMDNVTENLPAARAGQLA